MERLTQKIRNTKKRRLAKYLEILLNGILNIFHRSGPRAPIRIRIQKPYSHPCSVIMPSSFHNCHLRGQTHVEWPVVDESVPLMGIV